MRASGVPIDELRQKYQADPGSLSLDEIEAIAKYKKIVGTPAATQGKVAAVKKKQRGRPKKPLPIPVEVDNIYRVALDQLKARQANGEKLTGADYAFLDKMAAADTQKANAAMTREIVQGSIDKKLQFARIKSFHVLSDLLDNPTREDVRMQAALALKKWADDEEPPQEPVKFTVVKPSEVPPKIVPIQAKA